MAEMRRTERNDLMGVVKLNARVAKNAVAGHEAKLLAQVEEELSARYSADNEAWKEIVAEADKVAKETDARIAAICRERGIREEFRPSVSLSWYSRGENMLKERRAELRKLAQARIAAAGKEARAAIDARSAELQTELVAGSLQSEDARQFLAKIPSPAELMPPVTVAELEALEPPKDKFRMYDYSS